MLRSAADSEAKTDDAFLAGVEGRSLLSLMAALTGEGDYEGLNLIMSQHRSADTETFWGVILPSDQLPPTPDPVEHAQWVATPDERE